MSEREKYERFRQNLSPNDQKRFDDIFQRTILEKQREILESIKYDLEHLVAVNFCCNFFTPGLDLSKRTGYTIILIEPMYKLGVKNFDFALFRRENNSLILVECKSSISYLSKEVNEISKALDEAKKRRDFLEETIGDKISLMEFVLCVPFDKAQEVNSEICSKDLSICTWAFSILEGTLQLISRGNLESEINSGRIHRDSDLRRLLLKGVKSLRGAIYTFPLLPSSNRYLYLAHVIQQLFIQWTELDQLRGIVGYVNVFSTLLQALSKKTTMNDSDLESLAKDLINLGSRKEVFDDLSPDTDDVTKKLYRLTVSRTDPTKSERQAKEKFIEKNALKSAYVGSIPKFQKEAGFKTLNTY